MAGSKKSSVAAAGLISGAAGVLLALFTAVTANSVALWADWIATLLDFLAILIAWWGLEKAEAGKTEAFNYGFGRLESLASMGIAAVMVISFLCITSAAFMRFRSPVPVQGLGVLAGIGLHFIFGFINSRLAHQSLRLERREKSALVTAQRRIFTIKACANVLMFCSLSISYFLSGHGWSAYADPVAAVVIAGTLLAGASKTFRYSVVDLLDCAIGERSQILIIRVLTRHFDEYQQIRDIRTRRAGSKVYIELFLEFSPELEHGAVMNTIRSLQQEIEDLIPCDEVLIIPL